MINKLKNKFTNRTFQVIFTIVVLLLFIGSGFLFLGNELIQNKAYCIKDFKQEQDVLIAQIGSSFQKELEINNEVNYNQFITETNCNTGNRWIFICNDEKILCAKDDITTETYSKNGFSKTALLDESEKNNFIISTYDLTYNGSNYTIGICTSLDTILDTSKITKHNLYLILLNSVLCSSFFIIIVVMVSQYGMLQKKFEKRSKDLKDKNLQLESLYSEYNSQRELIEKSSPKKSENKYVDYKIVKALLEKSDGEEFRPLSMIVIKLFLADKYFTKAQMYDLVEPIHKLLKNKYVMAEVAKGEFVIIMYKTDQEETEEFRNAIQDVFNNKLPSLGITVRVGYITLKDNVGKAFDFFQILYEKLRGK